MTQKLFNSKSPIKSILFFTVTMFAFMGINGFAQTATPKAQMIIPADVYQHLKETGKLNPDYDYRVIQAEHATPQVQELSRDSNGGGVQSVGNEKTLNSCNCLIPNVNTDPSFSVAEITSGSAPLYRNDDGSTAAKSMAFNFCMYGVNYNQFYINNNGNISFGASYGTYNPIAFPSGSFVMVAPFWADVDTQGSGSGVVYYKITPTYVIVQWYRVGYFSSQWDKLNTFQCIISDGTDPIIPNGNNVAFCYGSMNWTTGSASGGVNGFGGFPATVGVNKGNGIDFAQVGRFGQAGAVYNGPVSTTPSSGVSWLNNQSFYFNTCATSNIPPIVTGLNNCDTIRVCSITDSVLVNAVFLSPEAGQITNITVNTNGIPGISTISNTSGNVATAQVKVVASILNAGLNIIQFTATDNGVPAQTSVVNAQVFVDTSGFVVNNSVLNGVLSLCQGNPTTLSVTPTNANAYLWSNGSTGTSVTISTPGPVWVTSSINGCVKTMSANIQSTFAAGFNYNGSPFCQNVANPVPIYVPNGGPGIFSSTPTGLDVDPLSGVVNLSNSATGTYTITNTIAGTVDCPSVSASTTITITPAPDASFNYPADPYCNSAGVLATPAFIGGGFAGTFSAIPSVGIVLDPVTGIVDAELSQPGTYTVINTIAAVGGCADAVSTTLINILPPAVATFTYIGNPFCKNAFNPTPFFLGGGVAGTFTSSSTDLVINPTTGTVNLALTLPGTYTITNTLQASGPCPIIVATFDITITAVPVATFSYVGNPFCQSGGVDPSPTYTNGGTGGVFTYSPSSSFLSMDGSGTVTASGSDAGTYTVTNTIPAAGGCQAVSSTATIIITPTPDGFFFYPADPYCKSSTNPVPTLDPGGTMGVFSAQPFPGLDINPTTGEVNLANSVAGTYTVYNDIASANSCPAIQATASITVTDMPIVAFDYPGNPFCQSALWAYPNFLGQTGLVYSNDPNVVVGIFDGSIDLVATIPGTYSIYNFISASGGCPDAVDTTDVTIVSEFSAAFSYTGSPYCQSTSTANPTYTNTTGVAGIYSASPSGLIINSATGAVDLTSQSGTYTVTNQVMSSGGCAGDTATSTIIISPTPNANFSYPGSPYCVSGPNPMPNFTGGGTPGTFSSTLGLNFVSTSTGEIDLASSTAGTYIVTNTVGGGLCPAAIQTATVVISTQFAAGFSYAGSPYCQNGSNPIITLASGSSAGTFTASSPNVHFVSSTPGEIDLSLTNPGVYTITNTVPASGACASVNASTTITITPTPIATFSYTSSPYCQNLANPSPTYSNGGFAGTFTSLPNTLVFAGNPGQVDLAGSPVGTFTVTNTIAATGGCPAATATATITITVAPLANFSYTGTPYCQASVNPFPTFGTGAVAGTFAGTGTGTFVINFSNGNVNLSGCTPGTYTVTNTIPATGGCGASVATATIDIVAQNIANFSYVNSPYCQNGTNPLPTLAVGGTAGTFSVAPTTLIVNSTTGLVDLTSATGNFTVTNSVPANACPAAVATTLITVTAMPIATFAYTGTPYCQDALNPSPLISTGGTAGVFSSASGLHFVSVNTGVVDLSSSTASTYTVTNTVAAAAGCPAVTATATITINAVQIATFNYSAGTYCKTGNTPAPTVVTPNGTFTSSPAGLSISASNGIVDLTNSGTGTYTITYATPGPCAGTSTQQITILPAPVANAGTSQTLDCILHTATLSGGASSTGTTISYSWEPSANVVSGGNTVNPVVNQPGTYTLTVTNSATPGCPATSTVVVSGSIPVSSFTANPTQGTPPLTVNFTNTSTNATSYIWSFPGGIPNGASTQDATTTYATTGTYVAYLTVSNSFGCVTIDSSEIIVYDGYSLVIPNMFSPDDNGINDLFSPVSSTGLASLKGEIYDRWGLKIFNWNELNGGWDGRTTSGSKAAEGTYFYIIQSTGMDGSTHEDKGFVTLFRK